MKLRTMKIARRCLVCFGLIAGVVVALGVFAIIQMSNIRAEGEVIEQDSIPGIVTSNSLALQLARLRYEVLRIVAVPSNILAGEERLKNLQNLVEGEFAKYKPMIDDEQERSYYEKLAFSYHDYSEQAVKAIAMVKENKVEDARVLIMSSMAKLGSEMNEFSAKLQDNNLQAATQHSQAGTVLYSQSKIITILAIIIAFSLTIALSWLMTRSLTVPINTAVSAAQTIAAGDLTQNLDVSGNDEAAQLLKSMSAMQQTLRDTLEHIGKSAEQLASSTEEMSAVMSESAKGLQQQNNEIEMAATAVTEMSHAVEEVASNAVATSSESKNASATAGQGQVQLSDTLKAIGALTDNVLGASDQARNLAEQTRNISKVLDVIRAVAEQTNLLALNAAIEAARAGEAGRGFAVVADEVRSLAHRTGESTREIEAMIGSIQNGTDQTVNALLTSAQQAQQTQQQAQSANEALSSISQAVSGIDERNMVIASAAEEQAQVAKEVDRNLVRIRDLSIQTSAGAEQTHSASQELSRLAGDLNGLVRRFKV